MDQTNQRKTPGKNFNFFIAPHCIFDDEKLRRLLSHAERDFLMLLCHLSNRYGDSEGWFWHTDKSFITHEDKKRGFASFGFSRSTCRRVRKKLTNLGLIEIKQDSTAFGRWPATMYRLNPRLLKLSTKESTVLHSEARSSLMVDHGQGPL